MLQLRSNKFRNTYNVASYYHGISERLGIGNTDIRVQNHTMYFRAPQAVDNADLPLHMNGIELKRYYFRFDEDEENNQEVIAEITNTVCAIANENNENIVGLYTCYVAGNSLEDKEYVYPFIDTDLWKEHKDNSIASLYNKCVEQTSLRESERQGRDIKQHIRVFQSKIGHNILLITDYVDVDQESETFLSIGLTPIFFEDFKSKFSTEEMEYFKCLVNRSQVKRISNVKATACFSVLEDLQKYDSLEREIRYKTLFKKVAESRVRTIERNINNYRDAMDSALRSYDEALKKVNDYEILINKYKEGQDDIVEELRTISKAKGVYDINTLNDGTLKIVLRVPLDYFDSDEAECAIRNIHNDNVCRFINDVFIEQKYKLMIRTDAYYTFSNDYNFQDFGSLNDSEYTRINALFNPHFQYYHCLGDYKPSLIKAMRDQDITLFVNIAIAAARSMNFKDGAVCNRWFSWLADAFDPDYYNHDYYMSMKCLEKDGKLYTLGQWLNNNFEEEQPQINVIEAEEL